MEKTPPANAKKNRRKRRIFVAHVNNVFKAHCNHAESAI